MSEIKMTRCDACGVTEEDPWPPFMPITIEVCEPGEEGWTLRKGHFCDDCVVGVLQALEEPAMWLPLVDGIQGTAQLADAEEFSELPAKRYRDRS